MYPSRFLYFSPRTIKKAAEMLSDSNGSAKILAGGMSLIPMMKMRVVSPQKVIDLRQVSSLKKITEKGRYLFIGSMVSDRKIESSGLIKDRIPLIAAVANNIGDPQVRNRGTIGGSLSHADPSGDWGPCFLALRGSAVAVSVKGKREINSDHFFTGPFSTALKEGEILERVMFPVPDGASGHSYVKIERKAGDFATASAAVQLSLDQHGRCSYIGIGLGAVSDRSIRAAKAEKNVVGKQITDDIISEAAESGSQETDPYDDLIRGSAEFKREMIKICIKKALTEAHKMVEGFS